MTTGVTDRLNDGDIMQVESGGTIRIMPGGMIEAGGEFELTNVHWEDLRFPAAGINPPGAASDPTRDTTDGRLSFSASATNIVAIQAQMPHEWKEGSAIHPHVHWSPTNTNAGNVKWELKYKVANLGEAFPADWTTVTVLDAGDGTADMHQIASFDWIDMTGKTFSCMILILLSRLGGDGSDTYNAACMMNEFDIHYQVDSFGTDEEYVK